MRRIIPAIALLVLVGLSACADAKKAAPPPPCPLGTWKLSAIGMRDIFGAELKDASAAVTGSVIMALREDGAITYQFTNVVLGPPGANTATTGNAAIVGVTGTLTATSTRTVSTIDITAPNNALQVSQGGLPSSKLTIFVSTSLEQILTGPATYACRSAALSITYTDTNTTLLWNRASR